MNNNNKTKYYYVNKYIVYGCFLIIAGSLITLLLYNFIGFSNSYRIMSKEMLLAIKQYNIDLNDFVKQKFVFRILELIIVSIILRTKYNKLIKWGIVTYLSIKIGLIFTIFIIEMQFIGIINYLIISFPHDFIYIYCLLKIFNMSERIKKSECENRYSLCNNFCRCVFILILWSVAILSETCIKNILVKKLFIISM